MKNSLHNFQLCQMWYLQVAPFVQPTKKSVKSAQMFDCSAVKLTGTMIHYQSLFSFDWLLTSLLTNCGSSHVTFGLLLSMLKHGCQFGGSACWWYWLLYDSHWLLQLQMLLSLGPLVVLRSSGWNSQNYSRVRHSWCSSIEENNSPHFFVVISWKFVVIDIIVCRAALYATVCKHGNCPLSAVFDSAGWRMEPLGLCFGHCCCISRQHTVL